MITRRPPLQRWTWLAAACFAWSLTGNVSPLQAAELEAELLSRYLGERGIAVIHIDLSQLEPGDLKPIFTIASTYASDQLPDAAQMLRALEQLKEAGAPEWYLVLAAGSGESTRVPSVLCLTPKPPTPDQQQRIVSILSALIPDLSVVVDGQVIALGSAQDLAEVVRSKTPPGERPVAAALATIIEAPLGLVIPPTADQRRVWTELGPNSLNPTWQPLVQNLFDGAQWLSAAYRPKQSFRVTIQMNDDTAATAAASRLAGLFKNLKTPSPSSAQVDALMAAIRSLQARADASQVVIELAGQSGNLQAALGPSLQAATAGALRDRATRNLRHVGLAMHNYHAAQGRFPDTAIYDPQGKPLLSWRVMLLPYLDQEPLYKEFHLDESWDSEHNRKLIARMPEIFRLGSSEVLEQGKTCVQVAVGPETAFPDGHGLKIRQFVDGTSNTLMGIETADDRAVVWTKPEDWQYDPQQPAAGLGGHFGTGFLGLMSDGSVHFLPVKDNDNVLKAIFTPAGKEPVRQVP
jgi:hypothetical protein